MVNTLYKVIQPVFPDLCPTSTTDEAAFAVPRKQEVETVLLLFFALQ